MNYHARFSFVGTPVIPKQKADSKHPFCREIVKRDDKGKKREMLSMTFGVKASDSNMAFVEAFDGVQDTIKTMNTDNEKMDIAWEDRFDEDIVFQVANYRKYTVDLGEDYGGRHEFITVYDMITYLQKNLPEYKGRVLVTGQFTRSWYKNTYYSKFHVQNVFAVPEDRKNRLMITADLFYNKNGFDNSSFDDDKKITLDCYMEQYINKDEGRKYVPLQVVFSAAKYDMENDTHKKRFENMMSYLNVAKMKAQNDQDEIVSVKGENYVHIPWEIVLLRGAEEVEFDKSMLTARQLEQVELGIRNAEDFRPRGNIYGDKIDEFRLKNVIISSDEFKDGYCKLADDNVEEFEEKIYQPPKDETLDEAKKNSKKSKSEEKKSSPEIDELNDDDDTDDLF